MQSRTPLYTPCLLPPSTGIGRDPEIIGALIQAMAPPTTMVNTWIYDQQRLLPLHVVYGVFRAYALCSTSNSAAADKVEELHSGLVVGIKHLQAAASNAQYGPVLPIVVAVADCMEAQKRGDAPILNIVISPYTRLELL
jgi:hypothetical protein